MDFVRSRLSSLDFAYLSVIHCILLAPDKVMGGDGDSSASWSDEI